MTFLIRFYPYIAAFALAAFLYMKGYGAYEADQNKKTVKEEKAHVRIEQKIMRLPDPDLDKRLSKWLRE